MKSYTLLKWFTYDFVVNPLCSRNNGLCSTFCFPTPTGRTCGCQDNTELLSDQKTCEGGKQMFMINKRKASLYFFLIMHTEASYKWYKFNSQFPSVQHPWQIYSYWTVGHIPDKHVNLNARTASIEQTTYPWNVTLWVYGNQTPIQFA